METWKALGEFTDLPEPEVDEDELLAPPVVPVTDDPVVTEGMEPAWEQRKELGVVPALLKTVKQILNIPSTSFRAMKKTGGFAAPLLFFVVLATLGTWMSLFCEIVMIKMSPEKFATNPFGAQITPAVMINMRIAAMILTPLLVAVGAFITSGAIHLVVMGLCGAEKTYEATFRAYCYAVGSASVFLLIPICGSFIYLVVALVVLVIAIREVHGTSTGMATAGVLIPAFTCCGLMIGLSTLVYAGGLLK